MAELALLLLHWGELRCGVGMHSDVVRSGLVVERRKVGGSVCERMWSRSSRYDEEHHGGGKIYLLD